MKMIKLTETITGNVARSVNPIGRKLRVDLGANQVQSAGMYDGAKNALILGGASGYGLASRMVVAFAQGANTFSVGYERAPQGASLGSAGWWNQVYVKQAAEAQGLRAVNLNADAFLAATKQQVIDRLRRENWQPLDLIVYAIAAPKRVNPADPTEVWRSAIKPIGQSVTDETLDLEHERLVLRTLAPATPAEIAATVHVMGGEDWELWLHALKAAGGLAPNCKTILFSYEGPEATAPIYHDGTLGRAKRAAEASAKRLQKLLAPTGGEALISVNRSVTTRASMVIPGFARYCMALYQVEQAAGGHERSLEHIDRLFRQMVYGQHRRLDDQGRLRPDAQELAPSIQAQVNQLLAEMTADSFSTNWPGYQQLRREFRELSGFGVPGIRDEMPAMMLDKLVF
ncbi:trans-2-enoyl-CoA reductase [Levilactobacillus senmaizukei DSM 21775 = NBRC 103853]|uniref:trans-2-enoyl-CoA reductase (NAD(+)) n=1 Tax=Levilactobacillus senmaizukei DSM 21775 = NBRC 103853 TaxID=1423803 RepID=A0A0R2DEJ4_9LACO|nr:enoyl-[acyl-carrier-protein] reductase FabV [Levilactobacillus senmaizukei]KRN02370.1 trans-2-enoyl-CoA reductase [Levilactobacillus senmaizukei DSM 21775 = NBRC 103853]